MALNPNMEFDLSCDDGTEDFGAEPARPLARDRVGKFWYQVGQEAVFGRWKPAPVLQMGSLTAQKCSVANWEKS